MSDFYPLRIHYILKRLHRGPAKSTDLAGADANMPATQSALKRLLQTGCIERIRGTRGNGFGIEYTYHITAKGEKRLKYLNTKWKKT